MNPHCKNCSNKACFINQFCSPQWRKTLGDKITTIKIKSGQQIIHEGTKVTGVYFIYSGKIKVFKNLNHQEDQILRLAKSGDIFGHRGYGLDKYPISAAAIEDATVCHIDNDLFFATLKENPELTYNLMMLYASELKKAEARVYGFAKMSVKARIADILIQIQDSHGFVPNKKGLLDIKIARKDLANMATTTYETTLRVLAELTKARLIGFEGKRIKLLDLGGLERVRMSAE